MAKLATYNRRALKSAVVAGVTLGVVTLGFATFAQAGDVFRPGGGGHGGFSHGGNLGSHNGNFGGVRGGGQSFGGAQRFGGTQRFGGGQQFGGAQRFGGGQRFGRVAPVYGNGAATGSRTGHYAWTGGRHQGWRYGSYGVGAGLALGTGLAYGASAYPYNDGYSQDYAVPDYAYEGGDPAYAGTEYGDNIDPLQDDGDGAWDYNGTHYTCSPYEKKTRLQKRACGAS